MSDEPTASIFCVNLSQSLQILNFNIILTYKNVQQCSISFVVRDNQESWASHNCKLEWIKCFKEVAKKKNIESNSW